MDPDDPRARRVAAAARSPFPALRKYAQEAMSEPGERGYFTDPEQAAERDPQDEAYEPDELPVHHDAEALRVYTAPRFPQPRQLQEPEPEEEVAQVYAPPAPPQPRNYPPRSEPSRSEQPRSEPPRFDAPALEEPAEPRTLRQDLMLATGVAFLAFLLVRPLVPAQQPPPAPKVVPWQLTDRSGGTLEATVGAPVTALPPNPSELAIEIPLPDAPEPARPSPAASPVAAASALAPAAAVAVSPAPSPAPPPRKRVGLWLTVQSPAELAQIYTALARHHLERENWDQARYYADKVLSTWPDNADARRLRDAARKGVGVGP